MSTISVTNINDGDAVTAASINNQVNTIVNDYNGNITAANLAANAVTDAKITANNLLTTKFSNLYKFSVYLSSAQNTINGITRILYDAKEYDTSSNVDIVTNKGRFTAPVSGFYQFNVSANANLGTGFLTVLLYKNGSLFKNGQSSTAANPNLVSSWSVQLTANDYTEIFVSSGTVEALATGTAANVFSGFLISSI